MTNFDSMELTRSWTEMAQAFQVHQGAVHTEWSTAYLSSPSVPLEHSFAHRRTYARSVRSARSVDDQGGEPPSDDSEGEERLSSSSSSSPSSSTSSETLVVSPSLSNETSVGTTSVTTPSDDSTVYGGPPDSTIPYHHLKFFGSEVVPFPAAPTPIPIDNHSPVSTPWMMHRGPAVQQIWTKSHSRCSSLSTPTTRSSSARLVASQWSGSKPGDELSMTSCTTSGTAIDPDPDPGVLGHGLEVVGPQVGVYDLWDV